MGYQLGLDTGGTYTDAVLVDANQEVLASGKSLTTHDNLALGLRDVVDKVVSDAHASQIQLVSLSTTLATNALVEGRGRRVALVLVGFRESQLQRANLSQALAGDPHVFVAGGHAAWGEAVEPVDVETVRAFVTKVDRQVEAYAVSAVFAVRNPAHENEVQALIREMTGKPVTCGHHLSSGLDAPRRALTALLNARLIPMIGALLEAARLLLAARKINAPLMVVKGDGSLISDDMAMSYPVETILSGPAASVVGAQFLCRESDLVVSDMGGTTTDIAMIQGGQPRLDPDGATVGGWRTMVQAVAMRTYGLGGDSGVLFDRNHHGFVLGHQRVMPLSLLTHQYPELLKELESQLELPLSTTHSAQFVLTHGAESSLLELSAQQRELYERIREKPVAVQTLFSDQTMERALARLEQRGMVLRSAFTPSDAAHLLGQQNEWQTRGALLGAQLMMRYSKDNLGAVFGSAQAFAMAISQMVSVESAMVLLDAVSASQGQGHALSESQKNLLKLNLSDSPDQLISVKAQLQMPVMALGAPAHSYYPAAASMLGTRLIETPFAHVANALGAVVGSIRQEQSITITPAGGKNVSVLFPDGPQLFELLEAGATAASQFCDRLARDKARQAGCENPRITLDRRDTIVNKGDQSVFFESRICAVAVGRPSGMD